MVAEAITMMSLIGITIILGYVGIMIFDRTGIPDVIWLMLLGLLLGPIFGIVDRTSYIGFSGLLSALALLIILYDAGLNMNFYQLIRGMPRGTMLSVLNLTVSIVVIGFLSTLLFEFSLIQGMLLGAIIGGTSSPIVISISEKLRIRGNAKTMMELESIITDPLCIVVSIAIIQIMVSGLSISAAMNSIASAFSIGAMSGLILGVAWLPILDKLKGKKFDYMLTLALIFLLYVFTESVNGSGAVASLMFGIVLGNSKTFSIILRLKKIFTVDSTLKKFHNEIAFFVRSFFFVYIGLILTINPTFIFYGIMLSAILLIARILVVQIATLGMYLNNMEMNLIKIMGPRGLAAAVLAQLPIAYGIEGGSIYSEIAFVVILATVIYTTVATKYFYTIPSS